MGKHRRPVGQELTLAQWVRAGLRMLDEIDTASKREPMASLKIRRRIGDAVVALHDVRRMVDR